MTFRKEELKQWEPMIASYIEEERPPEEIRLKLDIGYIIEDQSIVIYTIPPLGPPGRKNKDSGR